MYRISLTFINIDEYEEAKVTMKKALKEKNQIEGDTYEVINDKNGIRYRGWDFRR